MDNHRFYGKKRFHPTIGNPGTKNFSKKSNLSCLKLGLDYNKEKLLGLFVETPCEGSLLWSALFSFCSSIHALPGHVFHHHHHHHHHHHETTSSSWNNIIVIMTCFCRVWPLRFASRAMIRNEDPCAMTCWKPRSIVTFASPISVEPCVARPWKGMHGQTTHWKIIHILKKTNPTVPQLNK